MEPIEEEQECVDQSEEENQIPLISGLPDDIAHFCLARVPRGYHTRLKCVSRGWRDLVCSEEWCDYRRKCDLAESWIYALCRDKFARVFLCALNPHSPRRSWKRVHECPPSIRRREGMGFAAMDRRLYVLGGFGLSEGATDEAYCYDVAINTWAQAPPLSTKRCYFACETLDGKIYAIGGLGLKRSVTWDVYDVSLKTWKSCSDSNIIPEIKDSFVMDGRIYVRGGGGSSPATANVRAAFYDPLTNTWQRVDNDMASGWRGPAVVVGDELYVLDQGFGTTLTMWCKETKRWIRLGRLAMRQPCRVVAVGNSVFVIGKDCYTVVVDVESARKMVDGVMVCSSVPKTSDEDIEVISCKCVAI